MLKVRWLNKVELTMVVFSKYARTCCQRQTQMTLAYNCYDYLVSREDSLVNFLLNYTNFKAMLRI